VALEEVVMNKWRFSRLLALAFSPLLILTFSQITSGEVSGTKDLTHTIYIPFLGTYITAGEALLVGVIAAGAAVLAALLTFVGVVMNYKAKMHELDITVDNKKKELDITVDNKKKELDIMVDNKKKELVQNQLDELIKKRIEVYPQLWCIVQTMLSDWEREDKQIDVQWARDLFTSLIKWHKENGVFISQPVYEKFAALRLEAYTVVRRCNAGQPPTLPDLQVMDRIYTGGDSFMNNVRDEDHPGLVAWRKTSKNLDEQILGLASVLKDDLGSYQRAAISV
jgi:hypothetical protein